MFSHEFETTQGDELSPEEMKGATWKVVETYVDIEELDTLPTKSLQVVFTHRIEVHMLYDLTFPVAMDEEHDPEE